MLGLHNAAPSIAYSLVNVAPSNNIRASERSLAGSRRSASFTGVPAERARQIAVTSVEAGDDVVQRRPHFVLVEGQDARQHRSRAGVLALEALLPGHEQPGDDSRPVGREPLRAARDEPGSAPKSLRDRRKALRLLQGRDHRQGRLRALVDGSPRRRATRRIRRRSPGPTSAVRRRCRPGTRQRRTRMPSRQIGPRVDGRGAGARVGEGGHLDRLLVETGPDVLGAPARGGGRREVAVGRFESSSHSSRSRPRCRSAGSSSATPARSSPRGARRWRR